LERQASSSVEPFGCVDTDQGKLAQPRAKFSLGIARAVALGWLWRRESGTYVRFTDTGAVLFA
jgi:hypothetical protein